MYLQYFYNGYFFSIVPNIDHELNIFQKKRYVCISIMSSDLTYT